MNLTTDTIFVILLLGALIAATALLVRHYSSPRLSALLRPPHSFPFLSKTSPQPTCCWGLVL